MPMLALDELMNPAPLSPTPLYVARSSNVQLNRQTTLSELYTYPPGHILEYPSTSLSTDLPVGHLIPAAFTNNVDNIFWNSYPGSFAYSVGEPRGQRNGVRVHVLKTEDGEEVPCTRHYLTCQGVKYCPFVDEKARQRRHTSVSRDDLSLSGKKDRKKNAEAYVFEKTLALYAYFRDKGCGFALQELTHYSAEEERRIQQASLTPTKARRGRNQPSLCRGRIIPEYTSMGKLFIRCEHYNKVSSRCHFINYHIGDGPYNNDYLVALLTNDQAKIYSFEAYARQKGYGPYVDCDNIQNVSAIRVNCCSSHRDFNGSMVMSELKRQECQSRFTIYVPHPEYRNRCPKILIVCTSPHDHPPPLPVRTPPMVQTDLVNFIQTFDVDLADLTARGLLRHPSSNNFLCQHLPLIREPTFIDLHPSLGNLDHLNSIISSVRVKTFPEGTSWEGLQHYKKAQDATFPPQDRYVRLMVVESWDSVPTDSYEDDLMDVTRTGVFKMAVCMFPQRSRDLLNASYIQTDISHKRIAGFKEFALVGQDRESQGTITYCRIFVNSSSAQAHYRMFNAIRELVFADTGELLKYRHIHSKSLSENDRVGILHWAMDQDGGQAKGLGLHFQKIVREECPDKFDLHEPHRRLSELGIYEHLHRIVRLCTAHFSRNTSQSGASDSAKTLMRSLACIEHLDLHGTLESIAADGKAGYDWVQNKIHSGFALQAICGSYSYIPRDIWKAGDETTNVIESSHRDVNREGTQCSLVGGVLRGRKLDRLRLQCDQLRQSTSMRMSYRPEHIQQTVTRTLQRQVSSQKKKVASLDSAISKQNDRLMKAWKDYKTKYDKLMELRQLGASEAKLSKAVRAFDKAFAKWNETRVRSSEMVKKGVRGTGNIQLLV